MRNKHRFTRTGLSAIIGGFVVLVAGTAAAAVTCWDFESLQVGIQYVVGNSLNFPAADVEFKAYKRDDGTWTANGYAEVVASNNAQGSGSKEVWLNNINASVTPDSPAYSVNFLYGDLGGNVNLGCNGLELEAPDNMSDLDGEWIGGCLITVNSVSTGVDSEYGEVIIEPAPGTMITKFGIGGQEFYVDDLCFDC
jgi:hypothetical protein